MERDQGIKVLNERFVIVSLRRGRSQGNRPPVKVKTPFIDE